MIISSVLFPASSLGEVFSKKKREQKKTTCIHTTCMLLPFSEPNQSPPPPPLEALLHLASQFLTRTLSRKNSFDKIKIKEREGWDGAGLFTRSVARMLLACV